MGKWVIVLAGQLLVYFQVALGNLEPDGQLIGVRRFGKKSSAPARRPVSLSSRRSREVSRMMYVYRTPSAARMRRHSPGPSRFGIIQSEIKSDA
jgi:hypothetical protein